jgi:hypothetical protein
VVGGCATVAAVAVGVQCGDLLSRTLSLGRWGDSRLWGAVCGEKQGASLALSLGVVAVGAGHG